MFFRLFVNKRKLNWWTNFSSVWVIDNVGGWELSCDADGLITLVTLLQYIEFDKTNWTELII